MIGTLSQLVVKPRFRDVVIPFLRIFLPLALIATFIVLLFFQWQNRKAVADAAELEAARLREASLGLSLPLAGFIDSVALLTAEVGAAMGQSSGAGDRLASGDSLGDELAPAFRRFIDFHHEFFQARLLDAQGQEVIRLERRGTAGVRVADGELQNKSGRYYFQEALELDPGEVYLSRLDLNVEHGEIELPYRPTLRIAQPVRGPGGDILGVVVANLEAGILYQEVDTLLAGVRGDIMWLDHEGFWLRAARPEEEWGFMLGKPDLRFGTRYPKVWKSISAATQGQVETDEMGLLTFATVAPPRESGSVHLADSSLSPGGAVLGWKLATLVSPADLKGLGDFHRFFWGAVGLALAVAFLLSMMAAAILERESRGEELLHIAARVTELTSQGVVFLSARGEIEAVNHGFTAVTGWLPQDVVGWNIERVRSGLSKDTMQKELISVALEHHRQWSGEMWYVRKDGTAFPASATILAIHLGKGHVWQVEIFSEASRNRISEPSSEEISGLDSLTKLPSRRLLMDRLEQVVGYCEHYGLVSVFVHTWIRDFAVLQRRLGRRADAVLLELGAELQDALSVGETVAHLGRGEFALLLLPDEGEEIGSALVAEILRKAIRRVAADLSESLELEFGFSAFPKDGKSVARLIRVAASEHQLLN